MVQLVRLVAVVAATTTKLRLGQVVPAAAQGKNKTPARQEHRVKEMLAALRGMAVAAVAVLVLLVAMLLVELLHSSLLVERVVSVWHRPYRVHQPTTLAAVVAQTTIRQAHKVVLAAMAVAGMVTMAQLAQLLERQIQAAALVEQAKM
jgi:hypothetical protein